MNDVPPPMLASPIADAVRPLEYASPVRRSRASTWIIGLIVSAAYAFSSGMIAFGMMMSLRNEREAPGFVAVGVFSGIFATGVFVTAWLARR